jgi:hypothetical protein
MASTPPRHRRPVQAERPVRGRDRTEADQLLDDALNDSFPASDPIPPDLGVEDGPDAT